VIGMTHWDNDERLMQDLREALDGAVSDGARSDARAAFTWRTIDEELMRLSHDSWQSEEVLVRKDGAATRVLGFDGNDFSLEIELDAGALMGQVVPGRACRVSVFTPKGESGSVDTDQSGFFSLAAPARGPVRLTVASDGSAQSTEWLQL
jgi:hypothetical protein